MDLKLNPTDNTLFEPYCWLFGGSLKAGRKLQPKLFPACDYFHLKVTQHTEQHRCSLRNKLVAGPVSCPSQSLALSAGRAMV